VKSKSKEQTQKEEDDFAKFAKKQEKKAKEKQFDDLTLLKGFWKAKELDQNETFLRE
jgi:protein KRI1